METILDLDAMLDGNLNDVADVPDYVTPPEGNYTLGISDVALDKRKNKDGTETPQIVLTYVVSETKETKGMPVADGSLFSERFTYNEDGLKYFKRAAKNILNVSDLNGVTVRDIFATLKDSAPFTAVISHSQSKSEDGNTTYTNVRVRPVHAPA